MSGLDESSGEAPREGPANTAGAIAQALSFHGVDRVFLMTGGDLSLWRALRDAGIQMCLARSEAGSVVMADAYARATGRTAVVYGQWGPGAANVAGALADAWWAGSPVLALTSTVPTTSEQRFEYQELDQPPMFAPVTKWQARINRPDRAAEMVTQALRIAEAGPSGPVHIDVPADLIRSPLDDAPESLAPAPMRTEPQPGGDVIAELSDRLRAARAPVILAGGGVLAGGSARDLVAFAEASGVPVATTMGGKGAINENHPLSIGVAGRYSRRVANEVVAEADVVLALGTDLGGMASDTYTLPSPDAEVLQVDLDASRMGRTRAVALAVVADAGSVCRALAIAGREGATGDHRDWAEAVETRVDEWSRTFAEVAARPAEGHVRTEAVVSILRQVAGEADVIVADTGFTGAWAGALFPVHTPGRTFLRAAGTLGWAFPAVLGAQLARPDARAFALVGDGGMGYNVGDIETAVRLGIPAITIVLNNACLGYEYVAYEIGFGGDVVDEVCDFGDVDFAAVATAFGAFGARVTSADEFRTALLAAVAQDRPAVLDVVVSKTRFAPVTTFDPFVARDL